MACRQPPVYTSLPSVEPTEHSYFSEIVRLARKRASASPENPSPRLPDLTFSDNSPFLGEQRKRFLVFRSLGYPDRSDSPATRPTMFPNTGSTRVTCHPSIIGRGRVADDPGGNSLGKPIGVSRGKSASVISATFHTAHSLGTVDRAGTSVPILSHRAEESPQH